MGNQGHSEGNYFQFKAWQDAGIIKDVTAITAHMNSARRWHGWDTHITSFPPAQPVPTTLDWDIWQTTTQGHTYNKDFVNGQWRCWFDFGMGALGDWGAHLLDTTHQFLNLGLPYEVVPLKADGHNNFFYPMSTTLSFKFPKRGEMPPVEVKWYDGLDNLPPIPAGYGVSGLDPNIPPPSNGALQPVKLNLVKLFIARSLLLKVARMAAHYQSYQKKKRKNGHHVYQLCPKVLLITGRISCWLARGRSKPVLHSALPGRLARCFAWAFLHNGQTKNLNLIVTRK